MSRKSKHKGDFIIKMAILEFRRRNRKKAKSEGYYFKGEFLSRYKREAIQKLREPFKTYSDEEKELYKDNWEAIDVEYQKGRQAVKKVQDAKKGIPSEPSCALCGVSCPEIYKISNKVYCINCYFRKLEAEKYKADREPANLECQFCGQRVEDINNHLCEQKTQKINENLELVKKGEALTMPLTILNGEFKRRYFTCTNCGKSIGIQNLSGLCKKCVNLYKFKTFEDKEKKKEYQRKYYKTNPKAIKTRRERVRKYLSNPENKEKHRIRQREWNKKYYAIPENLERRRAKQRKSYKKKILNPEYSAKRLINKKIWYSKNRERVLAKMRERRKSPEYRAKRKEYAKKYYQEHKEEIKIKEAKFYQEHKEKWKK